MITAAAQNQQVSTFFADITSRINKNNCKGDFADVAAAASTTPTVSTTFSAAVNTDSCENGSTKKPLTGCFAPLDLTPYMAQYMKSQGYSGNFFEKALQSASNIDTDANTGFAEQFSFSYSTCTGAYTEMKKYIAPSCLGSLGYRLNEDFRTKYEQNREQYSALQEKASERNKAVREKYGLDDLSPEEFYYKTSGFMSKEMTDFYYEGFDAKSKELIAFFYPDIAQHYGWDTAT